MRCIMASYSSSFKDSTGTEMPNLSSLKGTLTPDEEVGYFRRWQANPYDKEALDKLQSVCVIYIDFEAKKRRGYGIPVFDLAQEGAVGFMKALKKYNPDHESKARLASFAVFHIKAEMDQYVLRNSKIMRLATTKDQVKLFFKFRSVTSCMNVDNESLTGDQIECIAEQLDVSVRSVKTMESRFNSRNYISMTGLQDLGKSEHDFDKLSEENDQNIRQKLYLMGLEELDDRQRDILLKRYPSNEQPKASLKELAQHYDVSIERIRQIESQAIAKVKVTVEQSDYKSVASSSHETEFLVVHTQELNAV